MPKLKLDHLCKRYRRREWVLRDLNLVIDGKEFVAVLGSWESGKSELLRIISGMEKATEGAVYIDDVLVGKQTPSTGDVAMVFQNHALYPRMTIYENIAYSLKLQHMPVERIQERVRQVAEWFHLTEILEQKPAAVTVEQRRVVAIARAVVRNPKIVLLDEPFAGLDDSTRHRLRQMLQTIYQQMDAIFLYATHDPTEAMALGTQILILTEGEVQQIGTPQELYHDPANTFVAGLIGVSAMNFWTAQVIGGVESDKCSGTGKRESVDSKNSVDAQSGKMSGGNCAAESVFLQIEGLGTYSLSQKKVAQLAESGYVGQEIVVGVRPEQIRLQPEGSLSAVSGFYGMDDAGGYVYLESGDQQVTVRVKRGEEPELGAEFFFTMEEEDIHFFAREDGQRIMDSI